MGSRLMLSAALFMILALSDHIKRSILCSNNVSINENLFWGNVKKSCFWLFAAEVGQDPLPVFLAHL
jgi:hypothetical protein